MKISMIPNKIVKLIHASKGDTSLRKWSFEPYDNNGAISVSDIKDQLVYKTENGGTEQLLPVNTSTPATSYFDGTINYGADTDVEFTYKQSSYTGKARIKSIKGNTLVWNQQCNNTYQQSRSTISVSGTTVTITDNRTSEATSFIGRLTGINIPVGHKALISLNIKEINVDDFHNIDFGMAIASGSTASVSNHLYATSTGLFTGIMIPTSADAGRLTFGVSTNTAKTGTTDNVVFENLMVIDLTLNGFADNVDLFKSLFSLPYYAHGQYLLNFNGTGIKTTGKNLFSSEIVQGALYGTGNENNTSTTRCKTGGYIEVEPNTTYVASIVNTCKYVSYVFYDSSKTFISGDGFNAPFTFTTPSNCAYVRFGIAKQTTSQTITPSDVSNTQLEIGSSPSTYEPYTTSTTSLPISTYFPTGMKSAGTIYDELSDKAITRVGTITLDGTQTQSRTYNRTNGDIIMYYENQGWKPNTSNTTIPNILSNIGLDTPNHQFSSDTTSVTITITNGGELAICISGKTTASDVNTYLASNPVYVNYELATYTETDIKNASLVCKNIEVPCYLSSGNLVCDATEELTNESGFFDAKLKLKDSSGVAYSSKFKLHVEDL